jgi:hypothetical protein
MTLALRTLHGAWNSISRNTKAGLVPTIVTPFTGRVGCTYTRQSTPCEKRSHAQPRDGARDACLARPTAREGEGEGRGEGRGRGRGGEGEGKGRGLRGGGEGRGKRDSEREELIDNQQEGEECSLTNNE